MNISSISLFTHLRRTHKLRLRERLVLELTPTELRAMSGIRLSYWARGYRVVEMYLFAKLFESIIRFSA